MNDIDVFIAKAFDGFLSDPPDTEFQRGYLAALINVASEGLGWDDTDHRLVVARKILDQARSA